MNSKAYEGSSPAIFTKINCPNFNDSFVENLLKTSSTMSPNLLFDLCMFELCDWKSCFHRIEDAITHASQEAQLLQIHICKRFLKAVETPLAKPLERIISLFQRIDSSFSPFIYLLFVYCHVYAIYTVCTELEKQCNNGTLSKDIITAMANRLQYITLSLQVVVKVACSLPYNSFKYNSTSSSSGNGSVSNNSAVLRAIDVQEIMLKSVGKQFLHVIIGIIIIVPLVDITSKYPAVHDLIQNIVNIIVCFDNN